MENTNRVIDGGTNTEVVCTLTTKDAATQIQGWEQLRQSLTEVEAIDGGARLVAPGALADRVEELVATERGCCSFLDITTATRGETITIEVTTENPDGLPIISLIAGIPLP